MSDLSRQMLNMGHAARAATNVLRSCSGNQCNNAIYAMAHSIRTQMSLILQSNKLDMETGNANGLQPAMLDRLMLNEERIEAIAGALDQVAALPNIVGDVITTLSPPNGLKIDRVRVPIGVIGIIYESRPNVTADAGALCLKAGNAAILRGGSESVHSSNALHTCLINGLQSEGLPQTAIQYVPTQDREAVGEMLRGLDGRIDLIVPRGGKSLVARVEADARVPVLSHLDGICHTYVDKSASPAMARNIVVNAKMRRTGVCGATETVLIHRDAVTPVLGDIIDGLLNAGCEIRGDTAICAQDTRIKPANDSDWHTEYLDAIISIAMVDSIDTAITHIADHGSGHTESIITDDPQAAEYFLRLVDSAIVMHNASTQFADGGEFGLGAEIGIATCRLHARGPVGVEGLTTYKYQVRGSGQVRA